MKPRTLYLLVLATLVAGLLAWLVQRDPGQAEAGVLLLPDLSGELDAVTALVLEPAGGTAFRVERGPQGWRVPEQDGYMADTAAVARLVRRLAEARVLEAKTSNPALHDRLGVEVVDGRPGSGVLLTLEGAAGTPRVVIGQSETRGLRGTYVRRSDEDLAMLVDQDLQSGREPLDWLERRVLDIGPEDIAAIEITQADGERLAIDRDELGIFRIANLPEGRQPSGPTAAESLARALSDLRLDEVRSAAGWSMESPAAVARFVLNDGSVIEARSWRATLAPGSDGPWIALATQGGDPVAGAETNARLTPWLYRFPAWKHEQLARRIEDLLAPVQD